MSSVNQIYCTHCTYGNSALERVMGEMADHSLGYSARAGSLEDGDLRNAYRKLEQFLSYHLPSDMPAEQRLQMTASQAPRVFFYSPVVGEMQVLGQISYRQTDTKGRPGSYFGHVLFRDIEPASQRWSACDCLRLYGASRWVDQDSPEIPFRLPSMQSVSELLADKLPVIDDDVLVSFLTCPANGVFHDPAQIIPSRCRQRTPAERAAMLMDVLQGFLDVRAKPRQTVTLVVEPGLAALMFYGIFRLVPSGGVADGVSFCTYEANADRPRTTLLATVFCDPATTDLPSEAYQSGRGFTLNTFSNRRSSNWRAHGIYAKYVVEILVNKGWSAVDSLLKSFRTAGAMRAEDLENLVGAQQVLAAMFNPSVPEVPLAWRGSDIVTSYLREAATHQLESLDRNGQINTLLGSSARLRLLELFGPILASLPTQHAARKLLQGFPEEQLAKVLEVPGVSVADKLEVLGRFVTQHGKLPPGCEFLWESTSRQTRPQPRKDNPSLGQLLSRLDLTSIAKLGSNVPANQRLSFLTCLFEVSAADHAKRDIGVSMLTAIVDRLDDDRLYQFLREEQRAALLRQYLRGNLTLRRTIRSLLDGLPDHLDQVEDRLQALRRARDFLVVADQERLDAWVECVKKLRYIETLAQSPRKLRATSRKGLQPAGHDLAKALANAMPREVYDDEDGSRKLACLRGMAGSVLANEECIPPQLWQQFTLYFEGYGWKKDLRGYEETSESQWTDFWHTRTGLGVLAGIIAVTLLALGLLLVKRFQPKALHDSFDGAESTSDKPKPKTLDQEQAKASDKNKPQAVGGADNSQGSQTPSTTSPGPESKAFSSQDTAKSEEKRRPSTEAKDKAITNQTGDDQKKQQSVEGLQSEVRKLDREKMEIDQKLRNYRRDLDTLIAGIQAKMGTIRISAEEEIRKNVIMPQITTEQLSEDTDKKVPVIVFQPEKILRVTKPDWLTIECDARVDGIQVKFDAGRAAFPSGAAVKNWGSFEVRLIFKMDSKDHQTEWAKTVPPGGGVFKAGKQYRILLDQERLQTLLQQWNALRGQKEGAGTSLKWP